MRWLTTYTTKIKIISEMASAINDNAAREKYDEILMKVKTSN